ncbi:MAG TPA: hypothetical protein VGL81_24985 [Polyangiaceae bacterium]
MIRRGAIALACAASSLLPGCLVNRSITDFAAHPTYNNYKVETTSSYYAFFTSWVEYDAWTCQKLGAAFHCTKIEYDASRMGMRGGGPGTPPPAMPLAAARASGQAGQGGQP